MKTIYISKQIGTDLRTRSFFRRDLENLLPANSMEIELDFSNVIFISRSVADELCNILLDYPSMHISGMEEDVEMMYKIVVKGRNQPREYPTTNTQVYHLKSMKEMADFFSGL